ncbi:MAG: ribonuclease E/G, partial [Devosia sp.]|nr:ribonuclease E/G [Devosia sp.]
VQSLEVPQGMGLIVRTAGAARPKPEIRRDCEYLMRLWDDIRETTFRSTAPALIYEEANLIKRTIRDGYSRDIDEVVVDGEAGWRAARDFMRQLMPSHARKVQLWRPEGGPGGGGQPLFAKHGVEDQLDSMLVPTVQLKSGGYLVINQAEALVAIDVNSGRSTRERGIEETALRTNLEAAEEAARQLRLRDLAGLIVFDFIDMESKKHNAMVERRLKEALKNDRARIQVGQISHFGLLEMSRQRLRPSLTETSFITCPHCAGMGLVRNLESSAVHVLRQIEEEGAKARAGHIMVHVANAVAMCILNTKRERLSEIEARYAMRVHFSGDDSLPAPQVRIDRLRPPLSEAERAILLPTAVIPAAPPAFELDEDDTAEDFFEEDEAPPAAEYAAAEYAAAAPVAIAAPAEAEAATPPAD